MLLKITDLNRNLLEYERLKLSRIEIRYGIKMMDRGYYGDIQTEISNVTRPY